jgi:high-affinity iron transporter
MIGQLVITFREALEALLLVTILIAYLKKTGREQFVKSAIYGVLAALVVGAVIAASVMVIYGGLGEGNKELFEGVASLLAVAVLTYMVYWMAIKGREIRKDVEKRVESSRGSLAIAAASFVFVVREVIETILFLIPFAARDAVGTAVGAVSGVIMALVLSYGISAAGMSFDLRRFFYYSSILLILIAGGLAGYGVHELIEYAEEKDIELGWLASPAYDLGIDKSSPFHHKGIVGSIFAVLFGYTVKAEWLRLIVHALYLAIAIPTIMRIYSGIPESKSVRDTQVKRTA